ncbi:MAG: penicillin acylase family protein [Burkholderia sp.]
MIHADVFRRLRRLACGVFAAVAAVSCTSPPAGPTETAGPVAYRASISRSADGIPHITAPDWGSLGYGYGYAQATDNLCTMAQAFVTYRGERSRYFGAADKLPDASTLGQPSNLDADFFFRLLDTDSAVARYRDSQPPALRALVRGFAAGYDRYLEAVRAGKTPAAHLACRDAAWVAPIDEDDVYRRLYAANLAGGLSRFIPAVANARPPASAGASGLVGRQSAQPPQPAAAQPPAPPQAGALADRLADQLAVGGRVGIGSNALAFGADGSRNGRSVLLGNPHWFWSGPDRFYEARLTVPGRLDVSGASFLGVPVVMIGFNKDVAWTHTVSSTRRFGVFELSLEPGQPTVYRYDGKPEAMTAVPLSVQVREPDGSLKTVERTLYTSRFGPLVNLGRFSPVLGWSATKAYAMADVNANNFRIFENFFEWGQARSLDQFIATQKRFAAMPWVNTVAIGRDDPRVWYADIGAVPNVPDTLAQACTTEVGRAAGRLVPGVPFLDGSRADCTWRDTPGAVQAGAFAADAQPSLLRRDFVGNMNNSYWLANPLDPIARHPAIFGPWGQAPSLRARFGYWFALHRIHGTDGYPGEKASDDTLRRFALDSRVMSAEQFKQPLLDAACATPAVTLPAQAQAGKPGATRTVRIDSACRVLRDWHNTGAIDDRGAVLWDAVWAELVKLEPAKRYAVPFDANDPVNTPRGLHAAPAVLSQALGAAVAAMQDKGQPLDLARGDVLRVDVGGATLPLFGGCEAAGYFTSACADEERPGHASAASDLFGNTYLQVVSFDEAGVIAHTMLAPSESDDPASPYHADGTRRYVHRQWTTVRLDETGRTDEASSVVVDGSDAVLPR